MPRVPPPLRPHPARLRLAVGVDRVVQPADHRPTPEAEAGEPAALLHEEAEEALREGHGIVVGWPVRNPARGGPKWIR